MSDLMTELHSKNSQTEFWEGTHKAFLISAYEAQFKKEVTDFWFVSDIVVAGDRILVNWRKRIIPKIN